MYIYSPSSLFLNWKSSLCIKKSKNFLLSSKLHVFFIYITCAPLHFFTRVLKSNFIEMQPFENGSKKYFFAMFQVFRFKFNENMLHQKDMDKDFQKKILSVSIFKKLLKKELYHGPSSHTLIIWWYFL